MAAGTLLSVDEYLALPHKEGLAYEYDEGRLVEVPAQSLENAEIQARVIGRLLEAFGSEFIVAGPTGFWLTPEVERVPDVCVLRRDRAATLECFHGSLRGAPEVAVEIISPSDSASDLERKIDQYLAAGVGAVVVLYPECRHVRVCRAGGETRRLGPGDNLELPDLLPGLQIPVDDLFPPQP